MRCHHIYNVGVAPVAVTLVSTMFTMATILFVRSCLKPFKCTPPDPFGKIFMVSNPEIECSDANAEYVAMQTMGSWCAAACSNWRWQDSASGARD